MTRRIYRPLGALVLASVAVILQDAARAQSSVVVRTLGDREHVTVMTVEGTYDRLAPERLQEEIAIRQAVAKEFLRTHEDNYDFLVIFTRFPFDLGSDGEGVDVHGRYYGIKNDVEGIGLPLFDNGTAWGSGGQLQGYIDMGSLADVGKDPTDARFETTLSTLAHELGHRWLSHARFRDADGTLSEELLGRDKAHWSFLLNSGNSVMYGNDWRANGDGTFTSVGRAQTFYSPLDLYLMGLRPALQVPPFTLLQSADRQADELPEAGATIAGTSRTITIDSVIAAEGERTPSSDGAPKRFKLGFVLLVRPGQDADGLELAGVNTIRDAFATRMVILTDGKAIVDAFPEERQPALAPPPPVLPPSSGPRTTPVDLGQALSWLTGRQQPDGSWSDSRWTSARDTSTAVELFSTIPGALITRDRGLAWLTTSAPSTNVDTTARRILTLPSSSIAADLEYVRASANASGGWGLGKGYQSDPLDTALALLTGPGGDTSSHLAYLLQTQNVDGGWGLRAGGRSSVHGTVTVLSALGKLQTQTSSTAIDRATTWLQSRQQPDGGFGDDGSSPADTARTVLYLASTGTSHPQLGPALDYLKSTQLQDGSWRESVFETALAVRALQFAELPNATVAATTITFNPASPVAGQSLTVAADVVNLGSTPLSASMLRVYDGDPAAGHLIVELPVAPLDGLARARISVLWDTHDKAGDHVLHFVIDPLNVIAESNEADNRASRGVTVRAPDAGIDLSIAASDITLSPGTLGGVPQPQSLVAVVSNLGRTSAPQVLVSLFDGNPAASGSKVGDRVVDVAAGGSASVSFEFDVHTSGDHEYFVVLDPQNALTESDRTNNSASAWLRATAAVDLLVEPGSPAFSLNPIGIGRDLTISAGVANRGTTAAFSVPVLFYIDDPLGRIALGSRTVDLQPGATLSLSVVWRTARAMTNVPVVVEINPGSVIAESTTANNRAAAPLTVTSSTLPNLRVAADDLQIPAPLEAGARGTLSLVVHNDGAAAAENVFVKFFAGDPAGGGTPIGSTQTIARLEPGSQTTVQASWEPVTSSGQTVIFAAVDGDNAIAEFAEDDNTTFITAAIRTLPDLVVGSASIHFTPSFPRQNEPVTIAATVINTGEQLARGVVLRFFDGNPTSGGVQIGTDRIVGDLAAGVQGSAEVPFGNTSQGVREIYVQADPEGRISEQSKNNNIAFRRLGVQDTSLWVTNPYFSPNGDGVQDTTELFFRLSEERVVASVDLENRRGEVVKTFDLSASAPSASGNVSWDGRDTAGRVVADGEFLFRLRGPGRTVVASAVVVVDNNASPITEAIGTEFFFNTNLTCTAAGPAGPSGNGTFTDFQNRGVDGWLSDDGGLVQWIQTQAPCTGVTCQFYDGQVGVYVTPPSGDTPRRITPDSWTMVPPAANGTDILDVTLAPGGGWIAVTVVRYTLVNGAKRFLNPVEYWVIKSDGSNLTLVGTSEEVLPQGSPSFYPVVFSPNGDQLLFLKNRRDPAAVNGVIDSTLIKANLTDGTQTAVKSYTGSSSGAYGLPIASYEWMTDGGHILVKILQVDDQNDPQQRGVTQYHVVKPDGSGGRLLFAGQGNVHWSVYILGPERVAVIGDRGSDGRFVNNFFVTPLWLFSLAGSSPAMIAPDVEESFVTVSPGRRSLAFSDSQLLRADGTFDPRATGIWIVGSDGRSEQVYTADDDNAGLYPAVGGTGRAWSADGKLVAFEPRLPFDSDDVFVDAVIIDTEVRSVRIVNVERISSSPDHIRGFFPDGRTVLTGWLPYRTVDIDTGLAFHLPLDQQAAIWGFSASGKYLVYRSGHESRTASGACWVGYPRDNEWTLTSMLNLSAELSFERDGGQLLLRGTAQDLNFLQYSLDFASVESPDAWSPIDQPSDRAVMNDVLARWIPPSEGSFYVRLTVADRAGNTTNVRRRVTWGATPAITNLTSSPRVFSPNGDGASDVVTLNYVVLAPIALEFEIFDGDNHLLRTIRQDQPAIGPASIAWDGRNDSGGFVENGTYRVSVRGYDLFVTVDNTPPDAAVSIGSGLHVVVPTNCIAIGTLNAFPICRSGAAPAVAAPYWVINGHVDDENLVSRRLEIGAGVNPSEWVLLDEGATRQGALAADGTIRIPIEDVALRTLTDLADVHGMRIRLTATDRAGNRTARMSDFVPEEIIAFAWDSTPVLVNAPVEQKPGSHAISIQHTLRSPVDGLTLQYRLENTETWTNGPSASASALTVNLPWDTSALLLGRTYEVRIAAMDAGAVRRASNVFSIHSNRFELTRIENGEAFGIESLREPLADIRLVLAETGDLEVGTGPALRLDPPAFVSTVNSSRVVELCRAGRASLPVRFKGIGQSGAVYYSNSESIPCKKEYTPNGGVLFLTATRVFAESCGQPNPEQVVIAAQVKDFGGFLSGSETLAVQQVVNGPLEPVEGARFPFSMTLNTSQMAEGTYTVRATARVNVVDGGALEEQEITTTTTFVVDRQAPTAQVTSPMPQQSICAVPRGDRFVIPIEGTANDANFERYEVEFAIGEVPLAWAPIGSSRSTPVQQGLLADWDVTGLRSGSYSLRIRTLDGGGNAVCQQVPVVVQAGVDIAALAVNRRLFSPNGDGALDDVTVTYGLSQTAVVTARVFPIHNEQPGAVAVRTLAASVQQLAGTRTIVWNGQDDNGARVADGHYLIVISASDGCGISAERRIRTTVDATPPQALINTSATTLGVLADIRGTATDTNFNGYRLEVGTAPAPSTWSLLAAESTPVQEGLLGKWRTPAAGTYALRLTATDEAGNATEVSAAVTLAERPGLITFLDADPFIFSPNGDDKLDVVPISYALGADASVVVEILDQAGGVVATIANATGVASGQYTVVWDGRSSSGDVLADGDYVVRITATAASDATSRQVEQTTVRVDVTAPEVVLDTPGDGMQLSADVVEVLGTVTDANIQRFAVSYSQGTAAPVSLADDTHNRVNAPFGSIVGAADGSYAVTVVAVDRAQNSRSLTHAFVIDRTAPVVSLLAPENGGIAGGSPGLLEIRAAITTQHLKDWVLRYAATGVDPPQWNTIASGAAVPPSEVFALWPIAGIPDATYSLSLVATSQAGAAAEARIAITIDNTPPSAGITAPPSGLVLTGPTAIGGTASDANFSIARLELAAGEPQSAVEYVSLATLTAPVAGGTLFTIRTLPRDGSYTMRLTVEDRAGLRTTTTTPVTVAAHPPEPPTMLSATREDRDVVRLTWQASPEPADRLAGYHVYRDSSRVTTTPVAGTTFSDAGVADGTHRYTVRAVNLVGIESVPSNEAAVIIDLTPPAGVIHSPISGASVSGLIDIRGTAAAADFKEYRLFIGTGSGTPALIRQSPAPVSAGVLGQYDTGTIGNGAALLIRLETEDLIGNVGVHQVTVTVDDVAPPAPVLLSAAGTGSTVNLQWQGDTADLAGYLLYDNSVLANADRIVTNVSPYLLSGTSYTDTALPDGRHAYFVVAVDRAGNTSLPSNIRAVDIETRAPRATIVRPASGTKTDRATELLAATPDLDVNRVQFEVKATEASQWTALGAPLSAAPFAITWDPNGLPHGTYQFRAVATDVSGHTDNAPPAITISFQDVIAPDAPSGVAGRVNGSTVTITWTANAESDIKGYFVYRRTGSSANVKVSGLITGMSFADADRPDGAYTYSLTAVDSAENESLASVGVAAYVYTPLIVVSPQCVGQPITSLTGQGAVPGSIVTAFVSVGEGPVSSATAAASGDGTFEFSGLPLSGGVNLLWVQAVDGAGNTSKPSPVSSVSSGSIGAVSGFTATPTGSDVLLNWNPPVGSLAGFNVYRGDSKLNGTADVSLAGAISSASSEASPSQQALDGDPRTFWLPVTSSDATPWWQITFAQAIFATEVRLTWHSDSSAVYAAADFELQRWDGSRWVALAIVRDNSDAVSVVNLAAPVAMTRLRVVISRWLEFSPLLSEVTIEQAEFVSAMTFTDRAPNGLHTYRVAAVSACGAEGPRADASVTVQVTPPAAPVGLTVTAPAEGGRLALAWSSTGPSTPVAGYRLRRSLTAGGPYAQVGPALVPATSIRDEGLTNGIAYFYVVTAVDAAGNESALSNEATGTPRDLSVPAPPSLGYPTIPARARQMSAGSTPVSGTAEAGAAVTVLQSGLAVGSASARTNPSTEEFALSAEPQADVTVFAGQALIGTVVQRSTDPEPILLVTDAVTRTTRYYDQVTSFDPPAFSPDGQRVALVTFLDNADRLAILDRRTGSITRLDLPNWARHLTFSPDGNQIAYVSNNEIWMTTLPGGAPVAVTNGASAGYPAWSPDGEQIAYVDASNGTSVRLVDIATRATITVDSNANWAPLSFAPDGTRIAFSSRRDGNDDIWLYDLASGTVSPAPAGLTPASRRSNPIFSPDGLALAYLRQAVDFSGYAIVIRHLTTGVVEEIATGDFSSSALAWLGDGSLVQIDGAEVRRYRPTGHFQIDRLPLNQGTTVLAAIATDAAKNESAPSAPITLTRETSGLPDLEVGPDGFLVYPIFASPGAPISISVSVRNNGDEPAQNVSLTVIESGVDGLGHAILSRTIPVIAAGTEVAVALDWPAPPVTGRRSLRAIVDPLNAIDELDETNNSGDRIVTIATGADPIVRAATDRESYSPTGPVAISAEVMNPGAPADFVMDVRIEDTNGYAVTTLDHRVLTAFGFDSRAFATTWSPAGVLAGAYRLRVSLTRADGVSFASVAAFTIGVEQKVAAAVTTDRASYAVGQLVVVSARVRNDSLNADLTGFNASIRVINTAGVEVARTDTTLGAIVRGAEALVESRWTASASGEYSVELRLDAGGQQQASANTAFAVLGAALMTGTVAATPALVRSGQNFVLAATVRNTGTVAANGVALRLLVVDPDRQVAVRAYDRVVDLAAGGELAWTVDDTTSGLPLKAYTVLLQRVGSPEQVLSSTTLRVVDGTAPVLRITSPAASSYHRTDVLIEVLASDDASGVDRVEFGIDAGGSSLLPVQDAGAGRYGFVFPASAATEGRRVLSVRAFDKAGNGPDASTSDTNPMSIEFVIDRTPPAIQISGVDDGGEYDSAVTPVVIVTDLTAVTSQITLDGVPFVSGTVVTAGGQHTLDVLATDQAGNETSRVVRFTITLGPGNRLPVANAGADQNVAAGTSVTLNGTASQDPDGDLITYMWRLVSKPAGSALTQASLSNATTPNASLTPDVAGTYSIELLVNDGTVNSLPDTVDIVAFVANVRPNADAGRDQQVFLGARVTVDGSQSTDADLGPQPLTYNWTVVSVPAQSLITTNSLENPLSATASFFPDVAGTFVLELAISDGEAESRDQVQITVAANTPPIANAGADSVVAFGATAVLDGSGSSDADGGPQPLSYGWSFVSVPGGSAMTNASLGGASLANASFVPDIEGVYVLALTVSDGASSHADNVAVTVTSTTGRASGGAYFYHNAYQEKLSLDVSINRNVIDSASWLKYYYTRTRTDLRSTQIQSITFDGQTATVSGLATLNNASGYRFVAVIVNGSPDAFSIRIIKPDGTLFYEYGNPIQGGDLVVVNSSK